MPQYDFSLEPYAQPSLAPGLRIHARITRDGKSAGLAFSFRLEGPADQVAKVKWPAASHSPQRRDELWKSTCLEIFASPQGSTSYIEMNVAPSGDWNVYSFSDYRSGMTPASVSRAPFRSSSEKSVEGYLEVAALDDHALAFGATAVIEFQSGEKEYWALSHRGEKPDFHLRSSFTATI